MTDTRFPDNAPLDALIRYVAGELSLGSAEHGAVERWIASDPAYPALVAGLRQIWTEAPKLRRTWNAATALDRIKKRPSGPTRVIRLPAFYRVHPPSVWRRVTRAGIGLAAAVAIIVTSFAVNRVPSPHKSATPIFEVSTARGQRASVDLSDGSTVTLGPMSSIRSTIDQAGSRTVHLVGQALFTVAHDSARLFIVRTTHGVVTDIGTRFVVRNYPSDTAVNVAVMEGEVALAPIAADKSAATDPVRLGAGDRGFATMSGTLKVERRVDVTRELAWSEGRLEFRATPMRDVVKELGLWYSLEIRLGNGAIARRRLTASFRDESIDEVVRLMKASLDARIERAGNVLTINSR
jgi:ferric-dicitrate binding protein FerR (iron transport regulator)